MTKLILSFAVALTSWTSFAENNIFGDSLDLDNIGNEVLASSEPTLQENIAEVSNPKIRRILRRERQVRYVRDAIAIKRVGLAYVKSTNDFVQLTQYAFTSPSDPYKDAVARFMIENVDNYLFADATIQHFQRMELRVRTVRDAISIKRKGLKLVRRLGQFNRLIQTPFRNPTDAYRTAKSSFIADNVSRYITANSRIRVILKVEGQTRLVRDAISVKQAGLQAISNSRQFARLTRYAFTNPSDSYIRAVSDFIRQHRRRYP